MEQKKGLSITAFIFALLCILTCCVLGFIFGPLAIIFAILALAKHQAKKGLAIFGLIIGLIATTFVGVICYAFRGVFSNRETITNDFKQLIENKDTIFPEYEASGEVPDFLKKYDEGGELHYVVTDITDVFGGDENINMKNFMDVMDQNYKDGKLSNIQVSASVQMFDFAVQ